MDNYIIDKKVFGDYISYKFNSLDFDDPFFVTYINLLHCLAENHENTYLFMLGIGYPELIREQLDYDDIVTV